jgi:dihydrodipicolinate synthase/N-acetylneuraminate lyase
VKTALEKTNADVWQILRNLILKVQIGTSNRAFDSRIENANAYEECSADVCLVLMADLYKPCMKQVSEASRAVRNGIMGRQP